MSLAGAKLTGGNPQNERVANDYYATNPEAVRMLLDCHNFQGKHILEPCVGAGHIANVLRDYYGEEVTGVDIVDRGYPNTIVTDFLNWETDMRFDTIITNPPYSLAKEFVFKCMELLTFTGQLAMFLRINFLETMGRKELFDCYPPKFIYVFRKRMCVFANGVELDPATGKPWATTLCNAWFVWKKCSIDEPIIRWL